MNDNDELGIINKCCRLLEDPEYKSYEEFTKVVYERTSDSDNEEKEDEE